MKLTQIIKDNQAHWATTIVNKLEESEPWFKAADPNHRAWLTLITQRGINAFADWLNGVPNQFSTSSFFENEAPRDLALSINFEQIVSVTQKIFSFVENELVSLLNENEKLEVQVQLLRFSRDVAFATALAYARAAEARSAWDARLEAKIIDALIDQEDFSEIEINAAGLGWTEAKDIFAIVGRKPKKDSALAVAEIHRAARNQDLLTIAGVRGDMLIALISNSKNPESTARYFSARFGEGSLVYGRLVESFEKVSLSTREAIAGYLAKSAMSDQVRVISATELLPERAINSDPLAQAHLIEIYQQIKNVDPHWLKTLEVFFSVGGSLEATARNLHIHVNTVRYRFKGLQQAIGLAPTTPRDGYCLQVAISLGRLKED
ncbi:MAG: helix-turn-helix domain-containing protein [Candidatus Nanopelagicales bacterium]